MTLVNTGSCAVQMLNGIFMLRFDISQKQKEQRVSPLDTFKHK